MHEVTDIVEVRIGDNALLQRRSEANGSNARESSDSESENTDNDDAASSLSRGASSARIVAKAA